MKFLTRLAHIKTTIRLSWPHACFASFRQEIRREADWFRIGFEPIFVDLSKSGSSYLVFLLVKVSGPWTGTLYARLRSIGPFTCHDSALQSSPEISSRHASYHCSKTVPRTRRVLRPCYPILDITRCPPPPASFRFDRSLISLFFSRDIRLRNCLPPSCLRMPCVCAVGRPSRYLYKHNDGYHN